MKEGQFPTQFGSIPSLPGRATPAEVGELAELCKNDPITQAVLEAVDSYAVVINAQRQILAANPMLLQALSGEGQDACRGLRLGEALNCSRVTEGPDGCGTSQACRSCGAMLTITTALDTRKPCAGECLISMKKGERWTAREFAVRALPVTVAGHPLVLLTLQDIGARKRRETLERIFIHDLHDSLQDLRNCTNLLQAAGASPTVVAEKILDLAGRLTADVESQVRLLHAEAGVLVPEHRRVAPEHILDRLEASLAADVAARLLRLPLPEDPVLVCTDPEILCRILRKMVLNAVEALPLGGQAQLWYETRSGQAVFVVQNPGCMPSEVSDRMFTRCFSTKADRGRGLGTYAMRLLGESVLGGKVGFTTNWTDGTRFFIELPGDV